MASPVPCVCSFGTLPTPTVMVLSRTTLSSTRYAASPCHLKFIMLNFMQFFHGVSNRLTGGGTGRCLGTDEAGGMGEGWSDVAAFWMEQTDATVKDYTMGSYVTNQASGIRSHPYSTSKEVNPYTYATLAEKHEVHDMGEIWANTLINVYAALVEASGFDADAASNADSTKGNAIFMQ